MNDESRIIKPEPSPESVVSEYPPDMLEKMARENLANVQQAAALVRTASVGRVEVGDLLMLSGAASQAINTLATVRIHKVLNSAVELASMLQKED